ncbi:prolyl 4-hydroxylase subunit alpha-2-like [Belonocnema kinseyi]|uniref:prolyl 4-hydroxylase subunit alpha-2-like n=1 Tax=Belonocnema kinseyi TaxID=2817044 RepID=UPI00143DED2B|nr:prolyl 4-hydroxylase subunit alpha-2-like [Belonocnema kinseyi]
MAKTFCLFGAFILSLLCTSISDVDSSNDAVHDLVNLLPVTDIVIRSAHNYLQEQEQRLANLRKHIGDYLREHERAIHKVSQNLSAATQEISITNDQEMEEGTDEIDLSNKYAFDGIKFKKLCRGEFLLHADIQKKLKCRYVDHGIPFLKIAPFKEEEAYLEPRIVVYHEVIYEEEIKTLKRLSESELEIAKTIDATTGESFVSEQRSAKSAWIEEGENEHLKLLNRRVEHLTGLTVKSAEDLQVAYYDVGGYYIPHFDFFDNYHLFPSEDGNRIATILFYMNDVAKGGGTAFPELNFTVWPKKGSALFWYNLKRNGEEDKFLLHGACPVLSGTKWSKFFL